MPIFIFLFLILSFSFFAKAESIKPTGSVSIFGIYTDENDRLDNDKMSALGEYEEWWSGGEGNIKLNFDSLKFEGYVRDDYDWFANLKFDAKRMFQFKGSVNRMFHYLGHEIPFPGVILIIQMVSSLRVVLGFIMMLLLMRVVV